MKLLAAAFAFALASLPAQAAAPPADFCAGYACSAEQISIQADFHAATALNTGSLPMVASGECYHLGTGYDPAQVQYGYLLLDTQNTQVYMNGTFGFFYPQNPYASVTLDQARTNAGTDLYADFSRVELDPAYAYINFAPTAPVDSQWQYWITQNADSTGADQLLVISQWGVGHEMFCRLKRNP